MPLLYSYLITYTLMLNFCDSECFFLCHEEIKHEIITFFLLEKLLMQWNASLSFLILQYDNHTQFIVSCACVCFVHYHHQVINYRTQLANYQLSSNFSYCTHSSTSCGTRYFNNLCLDTFFYHYLIMHLIHFHHTVDFPHKPEAREKANGPWKK